MIQFQVLSGKQAGNDIVARRFPFVIGRDAASHWRVDDEGVWDRHVTVTFDRSEGYGYTAQEGATLIVNSEPPSTSGFFRNGDVVDIGVLKVRFWLERAPRRSTRFREILTWTLLVLLFAAQLALIYALLQ